VQRHAEALSPSLRRDSTAGTRVRSSRRIRRRPFQHPARWTSPRSPSARRAAFLFPAVLPRGISESCPKHRSVLPSQCTNIAVAYA